MPSVPPRRTSAVLALAVLVLPTVLLTGPAGAQSAAPSAPPAPAVLAPSTDAPVEQVCAGGTAESPVAVEVRTLLPRAPTSPDEPFTVAGRLVNCGDETLDGLQVRLVVGRRLATRSELRLATREPVLGGRRLPGQAAQSPQLAPGASTGFQIRVRVADLRLDGRNGVHPLAVQARARSAGRARGPVGLASTFVPWFPEGPVAPTRLSWVVPLVDEPHHGPGAVMVDDGLARLLSDEPGAAGRLERALRGARVGAQSACESPADDAEAPADSRDAACRGERVPVTYAVDPDLLYSVDAMSRPYAVSGTGGRSERPASPDAVRWLRALQAAVDEGDLLALPYGDPDVVALSRTDSPVKDDVELLHRLGQSETRRLLDRTPLATVAWPPAGPVAGVVDSLAAGEGTALLLDESVVVSDPSQDRTPSARTTLPSTLEPVTALIPDGALSRLVEPDPSDDGWQGERLAEQRWIAETAIIAAERPGESRTLVVTPERRADLQPAVLAAAVADTGRLPWLCGVPLADVAAGTERCAGRPDPQAPAPADDAAVLRSTVPQDRALSPGFVRDVAAVRRLSDQFTEQVLLADSDTAKGTKARLLRARGRAASTAWREQPAEGRRMLRLLQDDVAALRGRIALVAGPALLTGRTGTVRLNVENGLDQPVNVGVRLDPTSAARLSSEDTALQVVPGRSSQQVSVRVEARTSGRFTARAGLVDASGQPFGGTVELEVRSTEYGRVALAVTGAAAAVLLVAAGVRITRRALRRPAPQAPAEPREPARPGSGV
ncbi:MAG: hypothetical protein AVDCRST_MAG16-3150 [uncultured Frankineae bacterium]|uniref:Secreted protein n=1 Tax=uncultured Frankineae bacterium TaxID=437475 RepID=A0A6J4MMC7_9ACTN|nr:MAG: hypothetical protein AVDCRST_MAG16-3150 [uncultured Frankineae bacterium]